MTIELQFDDKATRELLNAVVQNITNTEPVFKKIGQMMLASVKENFEIGGAYSSKESLIGGNKKWLPLSETTLNKRRRKNPAGPWPILVVDGNLRDSITPKTDKDSAIVGTNKEYAAIHNFGLTTNVLIQAHIRNMIYAGRSSSKKNKLGNKKAMKSKISVRAHSRKINIPARPFMTIHPDVLTEIDQTLINYIITGKGV